MYAVLSNNEIKIYDSYLHRESIKEIEGRRYDTLDKAWCVPLSDKNIALLVMLGCSLCDELLSMCRQAPNNVKAEEPILPMRIKATPYKHQIRAYNFALLVFGIGGGQ